jgi:hypothetical protein
VAAPSRIELSAGEGAYALAAEAVRVGRDLVVVIRGGDEPHVGAAAAAFPRPSLDDPAKTSSTASVIAFSGHQEDLLAREAALALAAACGARVVVTAGMHWEEIDAAGIAEVQANCRELVRGLIRGLAD